MVFISLTFGLLFGGRVIVHLKTEVVSELVFEKPTEKPKLTFFSRTLRVEISDHPLPTLTERSHYFDAHMHTIAEWSLGKKLLAPKKAFGGPIQMIKEVSRGMGFIPKMKEFKDSVIATDHNAFFSDEHLIPVGPTSEPVQNMVFDSNIFPTRTGQQEFTNMRKIFGRTFGEEVTLKTKFLNGPNWGSHLILMGSDHVHGPWHGGLLYLQIAGVNLGEPFGGEENEQDLATVLKKAAETGLEPFAFAAHPFAKGNFWRKGQNTEDYLELLHDDSRDFITPHNKFIFKGAQYWNGKADFFIKSENILSGRRIQNVDFFDLHPFENAPDTPRPPEKGFMALPSAQSYPNFKPDPMWPEELYEGLIDWQSRIRRLLYFSFNDAPGKVFPRKIYIFGGSDAHGDFNYDTSLVATVLDNTLVNSVTSLRNVTSNAFGKVRTYVEYDDQHSYDEKEDAIAALADGNSIVTDGPIISFTFDSEVRFNSDDLSWNNDLKPTDKRFPPKALKLMNKDGQIGGKGNFDGGFTALMVKGSAYPAIKYRWKNTSEFGPAFFGMPHKVEVFLISSDEKSPPKTIEEKVIIKKGNKTEEAKLKTIYPVDSFTPDIFGFLREANFSLRHRVEKLNGPFAISLGIFAKKSENENFRAYTNPIWVVPVDVKLDSPPQGKSVINFKFEMSMSEQDYEVELVGLNEKGKPITDSKKLFPDFEFGNRGWGSHSKQRNDRTINIEQGLYQVVIGENIIQDLKDKKVNQLLVYLFNPKDTNENKLNSIAATIPFEK